MLRLRFIQIGVARAWAMSLAVALYLGPAASLAHSNKAGLLTEDGFGPVRVGMPFQAAKALYPAGLSVDKSQDVSGQCFFGVPNDRPGIHLMFVRDVLVRIDVDGDIERGIGTEKGVAIGYSSSEVERIYRHQFTKIGSDGDGYTILVRPNRSKRRGLAFYIDDQRVTWMYAGEILALKRPEDCL